MLPARVRARVVHLSFLAGKLCCKKNLRILNCKFCGIRRGLEKLFGIWSASWCKSSRATVFVFGSEVWRSCLDTDPLLFARITRALSIQSFLAACCPGQYSATASPWERAKSLGGVSCEPWHDGCGWWLWTPMRI